MWPRACTWSTRKDNQQELPLPAMRKRSVGGTRGGITGFQVPLLTAEAFFSASLTLTLLLVSIHLVSINRALPLLSTLLYFPAHWAEEKHLPQTLRRYQRDADNLSSFLIQPPCIWSATLASQSSQSSHVTEMPCLPSHQPLFTWEGDLLTSCLAADLNSGGEVRLLLQYLVFVWQCFHTHTSLTISAVYNTPGHRFGSH